MRITDQDDVNHNEAVRVTALGVRIVWREARGKDTTRLENRSDRILDRAAKREREREEIRQAAKDAREQARLDAKKQRAIDRATRKYRTT